MALRPRHSSREGGGPLHLAVERYVHCPRGDMVALDRCEACGLMQGMLIGERLEILCAFPESMPAIRLHATWESTNGTQGAPAPDAAGERGHAALALAAPPARRRAKAGRRSALIFESDWPDD